MNKIQFILYVLIITLAFNLTAQNVPGDKQCMDCHNKVVAKKFLHKPVTEGCAKCHTPNGKKHPQEGVEGFVLTKKIPQLCFTCHDNKYMNGVVHKPVADGDCLACHPAHSSNEAHLTSLLPPKQCYFCHTNVKDTMERSSVIHGPMNDAGSCLICHAAHASPEKKILVKEEKSLCFSCHDKPVAKSNRTIPDLKKVVEKNKYVHGAIDNNGCAVCHNPHASRNDDLLTAAYPAGNYAAGKKDSYKLCFSSCHESTLIEDSLSRETGFRMKDRNLHFLHVNRDKGRSCDNCHDAHASNNLYLLADKSRFGSWYMPLRFKRLEGGGSCAPGCHGLKSYHK